MLVPRTLDARIREAAARSRLSKGEWVRRAIEAALVTPRASGGALVRLAALGAPTTDLDRMISESTEP